MRLATFELDYWQLRSGEQAHHEHPDTFWIPPRERRRNLERGQAAKLVFELECQDVDGNVGIQCERMWVVVAERVGEAYIGLLVNQPGTVEPDDEVYLCYGAEIPFLPEHVVDINAPPADDAELHLGREPARRWPRD